MAGLCSFEDLGDAWVGLQVVGGICMARGGKGQERIHVCELGRSQGLRGVGERGAYVE